MSNTSTEMSFAPETWSIRPATTIESGLNTRDIASVGDTLEEDSTALLLDTPAELELGGGVTTLEEEGAELELLATEELLSGAVTTNVISYFCPLTVTVSTALPTGKPTCTEPSTVTTSPDSLKSKNQIFHVSRLNVCTLLNVMVSNVPPAATVWFKLPVTTTWFASLEEDSSTLLLDTGSSLELLCSLEDDSSLFDDTSTLDDDGVSLEELGGTSLEEDSTALLLDTLAELELGGGVTTLEDEGSELELLASEEELLSSEELLSTLDDDGVSLEELGGTSLEEDSTELEDSSLLLDSSDELELSSLLEDSSLEDDSSLLEDATELEDRSTTVIFPAAEVLPSTPVTAIL